MRKVYLFRLFFQPTLDEMALSPYYRPQNTTTDLFRRGIQDGN